MKLKQFGPIYLLTIVNTFSFSLLIPVLPFLLETYNVGSFFYGVILSVFSFFQFLAAPFLGSLSDKYGRRNILLITQFGTFCSWVIFALALFIDPSLAFWGLPLAIRTVMGSRIIDGITGGAQSVANAYVSDLSPAGERTKNFGFLGMLVGLGIVIGPAVGGLSVHFWGNYFGPILASLGFSAFVFLYVLFNLKESLPPEKRESRALSEYLKEFFIRDKIRILSQYKDVGSMLLVVFIFGFVFQGFTTAYVWYTIKTFDLGLLEASGYMIMLGIFFAFNQGFLLRKLTKYFSDLLLMLIGFVFLTFGLGLFVYELGFWGVVLVTYLVSIGVSFLLSVSKSLLTQYVPDSQHGAVIGIEESLHSCNRVVAPLIAGLFRGLFREITFGFFGGISFIGLIIVYYLVINNQKKESTV